jgi:plastocyanin
MPHTHFITSVIAVVSLSACGGGGAGGDINQPNQPEGPNQPVPPSASTVRIVFRAETKGTSAFQPNPLTVALAGGGEVQWINDDREPAGGGYGGLGITHTVVADDLSFDSGDVAPGTRFGHTFQAEGTYEYHCSIHPAMRGTVIVTP